MDPEINYALTNKFLAAKAQLNTCTCVSVCPSARLKAEFLPVYAPLCPFMPLYAPLCPFMPLYSPLSHLIPLYKLLHAFTRFIS